MLKFLQDVCLFPSHTSLYALFHDCQQFRFLLPDCSAIPGYVFCLVVHSGPSALLQKPGGTRWGTNQHVHVISTRILTVRSWYLATHLQGMLGDRLPPHSHVLTWKSGILFLFEVENNIEKQLLVGCFQNHQEVLQ